MPHTFGLTDAALMRSLPPDCETVWTAVLKLYIGKMPNENKTSDGADISDDDEHSKRIKLLDEGIEWVRIKSWANLTVGERNAANKLGYTKNKWDRGFGIRTLRETLSQCEKDGKNPPLLCRRRLFASVSRLSCLAAFCTWASSVWPGVDWIFQFVQLTASVPHHWCCQYVAYTHLFSPTSLAFAGNSLPSTTWGSSASEGQPASMHTVFFIRLTGTRNYPSYVSCRFLCVWASGVSSGVDWIFQLCSSLRMHLTTDPVNT